VTCPTTKVQKQNERSFDLQRKLRFLSDNVSEKKSFFKAKKHKFRFFLLVKVKLSMLFIIWLSGLSIGVEKLEIYILYTPNDW
jgi:hypothetical protein